MAGVKRFLFDKLVYLSTHQFINMKKFIITPFSVSSIRYPVLFLLFSFFILHPSRLSAAEGDVIDIAYSGNSATVTIPATAAVTSSVDGAYVTLTSTTTTEEYIYRLSGTTSAGGLIINGAFKLTLQLAGVDITSQRGAAIDVECGKRIAVQLVKGTTNTLADYAGGSQKAALYFSGHPEFEGGGVLNITGNVKHAISAKEYLQIKKSTGVINILGAVSDGVHCGKGKVNNEHRYFQMNGGILNINNVKGDGIDSDDYGVMYINGGVLNVNVSENDAVGLKCDSIIYMTDGVVNVNVTGDASEGIRACYDAKFQGGSVHVNVAGNGSKAVKGKNRSNGLVKDGGQLHFEGTDFVLYVHGNDILAADGSVDTNCRAISSDASISYTTGQIDIYAYGSIEDACNEDVQTHTAQELHSIFNIHRAPWNFYYADFQHDMTAYVALQLNGKSVNVSDYAIGAFIDDTCVGVAVGDYLRIYSATTTASPITFRVYDYAMGKEYIVTADPSITFASDSQAGTAQSPIVLTIILLGDANGDDKVSIADVTAIINHINNIHSDTFNGKAADVNRDGNISISDVTGVINIINM